MASTSVVPRTIAMAAVRNRFRNTDLFFREGRFFSCSIGLKLSFPDHAIEADAKAGEDGCWHANHEQDAVHVGAWATAFGFIGQFAVRASRGNRGCAERTGQHKHQYQNA